MTGVTIEEIEEDMTDEMIEGQDHQVYMIFETNIK